jgi:hypothetical protein
MSIEPERRLSEMSWEQIGWMSRGDLLAKQRKVESLIAVEDDRAKMDVLNKAWWVVEFALRDKDNREETNAVSQNRR